MRLSTVALVAVAACTTSAAALSQRLEIPFSFDWRYKWVPAWADAEHGSPGPYGNDPSVAPHAGYWNRIDDYVCTGAVEQNPNRFNQSDCATACSYNPDCLMWQQSDSSRHCAHGFEGYSCQPAAKPGDGSEFGGTRTPEQAAQAIKTDYDWAEPSFDDTTWEVRDAPHDAIIEAGNFSINADSHHGFIERNGTIWYRKTFSFDSQMANSAIYVRFEGIFHFVTVWLDGKAIVSRGNIEGGYSEFTVRLDNETSTLVGSHVMALRVDASYGSGHWYEGGGLYRPVQLVVVPPVHVVEDGLYISPQVEVSSTAATTVPVTVELQNLQVAASANSLAGLTADASATVTVTLADKNTGAQLAAETTTVSVPPTDGMPAQTVIAAVTLSVPAGKITAWTVSGPPGLYTVAATVTVAGTQTDGVSTVTGFRSTNATVSDKYVLNGDSFEIRGFSHHNSFVGVGVAMAPRLELFRMQQSKAMGANFWRMSHNPYRRTSYEIADSVGLTVWDEHRDYGQLYVSGVYAMVKRTRNRPSVIMWSFCNEYECGCGTNATGALFRKACKSLDPNRPTAANGDPNGGGIDIQGHSHSSNNTFIQFHEQNPNVPQILSECCSCESQRMPPTGRALPDCISQQNSPGHLPFVLGSSGVWTAFDYIGESHDWPNHWSPYGQYSLAGFPKPHAFWYRANWLAIRPAADPGRPAQPQLHTARMFELLDNLVPGNNPGSVLVRGVTDSPMAELIVDGKSQGTQPTAYDMPDQVAMVQWNVNASGSATCEFPTNRSGDQCHNLQRSEAATNPEQCKAACCAQGTQCSMWQFNEDAGCWIGNGEACAPGKDVWVGGSRSIRANVQNITIIGKDAQGNVQSTHTGYMPSQLEKVSLYIDAPSPGSGTGSALALDGTDMGLVRAALEDRNGRLISAQDTNISFSVLSGPGRIYGVGSGDPTCDCHPMGDTCATYGGLVRAVVQVNTDCISPNRQFVVSMDRDANTRTKIAGGALGPCPAGPIVVHASAIINGTAVSAQISIPVSSDPASTAVETARSVGQQGLTDDVGAWLSDFQG
jgi:hypothetical protein